jgi:glucose-1-phosphatase
MKNRIFTLAAALVVLFACQPGQHPVPQPKENTEWITRTDGFEERYALDQMIILSRHNIRSPLVSKNSVLTRLTNPEYQWFLWEGQPSTLTPKGDRLEARMGTFFHEWIGKKGFIRQYSPDNYAFRFYANAKQRCQLTARSFADALLPDFAPPRVEMNVQFDTMDPVFTPQITKISDSFVTRAQQEIAEQFGDLNARMAGAYALLEDIIDIEHSPAYPDTTSFSQFPSAVSFKLNAEPSMSGGLKMACTLSDALSLQYYEEPDDKKAGFGKDLTFEDWVTVSSVKEWYGDVLFTAPSVSVNVAHPLLQLILGEMQNESRIFSFLCGHDSNVGSVLAALGAEIPDLPGSTEKKTPIGCKLIFETFTGEDKVQYADILLIYATAAQLRAESILSFDNPPAGVRIRLKGLKENADGLYTLSDVHQRFSEAIEAYDTL